MTAAATGGLSESGAFHVSEPSLTVIVCAYTMDRWADIEAAMDSLRRQTRPVDQIVLVSDHHSELLVRATTAFPGVLCVPNAGVRGLSGARNTGVAAATGEVVAFLDDDAAAAPDWAGHLLNAYQDATVIGVGGTVLPAWKTSQPRWFPAEFLWVVGCSYAGQPTTRTDIRNPIGANMSFRRDVFSRAGGFDPAMGRIGKDGAGCEETEFSIRARRSQDAGRIVLEPAAVCHHNVPAGRTTRAYYRSRCRAEGRSKAVVSQLTGSHAALETETRYVAVTLPRGVVSDLRDLVRGDPAGASRAWAIVEGTAVTTASYLMGRLRLLRR
jgi:GT2 family glycosyltransferase